MTTPIINPAIFRDPLDYADDATPDQQAARHRARVRRYRDEHPDERDEDEIGARNRRFMASERYP